MRSANRVAAGIVMLLGALLVYGGIQTGLTTKYGPGGGFMPLLIGIGLLGSGLALLVRTQRSHDSGETWLPPDKELRQSLIILAATVLTVALFSVLGMLLSIGIFMLFLLRTLEKHPWPRTVAVAVGTPLVIYLVFEVWLLVQLPTGLLGI